MNYFKALLAVVVSAIGALIVALGTTSSGDIGDIDSKNWLIAAAAVLASGGLVWLVENIGGVAPVAKAVMAFLSGGIASLIIALDDNVLSQAEWLTALSAAVVATGLVYQAKNASK